MARKILFIILFQLSVVINILHGQTWTSWYGNGAAAITAAAIDSSGNYWFGTMSDGLLVKKGNTWINYNQYNSQLASNWVKSVAVAGDGSIWAATDSGLCHSTTSGWEVYTDKNSTFEDLSVEKVVIGKNNEVWAIQWPGIHRYKSGTWTQYTESTHPGFYNDYPITLGVDNNGVCWAAGYGYEMWKFDGNQWSTEKNLGLDSTNYVEIYAIAFDAQNVQYVGTLDHGLYQIKSDTTLQYLGGDMGFYLNQVNDLMVSRDGKLWIAGEGGGIAIFDGSSFTNQTSSEGLGSDRVAYLAGNANSQAAINSELGISFYNSGSWSFVSPANISTFSTSGVFSMAKDKSSNLWLGGNAELVKFDGSSFTTYNTNGTGVPNEVITSIVFDSKNKVWISSYRGIAEYDPAANSWNNYDMSTSGLASDFIYDMAVDSKDVLWLATDSGLVKFDGMSATTYNKAKGQLINDEVITVFVDKNDVVWAGTWGGGLVKYDGSTWTKILATSNGLASDYITAITEDNLGNLAVGCYGGYAIFNGSNWINVASTALANKAEYILNLSFDINNDIWVSTDMGVVHRTPTGDVLYSSPAKPLGDNTVYQTLNDGKDMWFACEMVLSQLADAVTLRPSAVNTLENTLVRVHPNPIKQGKELTIGLENISGRDVLSIVDVQGKLVKEVKCSNLDKSAHGSVVLNTEGMGSGVYFISMNSAPTGAKFIVIQ